VHHDRSTLDRIRRATSGITLVDANGTAYGARGRQGSTVRIAIVRNGRRIGYVFASVSLDEALVRRLARRAGLPASDQLAIAASGRIVATDRRLRGNVSLPATSQASTVTLRGKRYRALATALPAAKGATVALVTPEAEIAAAQSATEHRILLGLILALLMGAGLARLEGGAIVRTIRSLVSAANEIAAGRLDKRVPVRGRDELANLGHAFNAMAHQLEGRLSELDAERARLRDVVSRFGAALAATHDAEQLLRIVVDTAVEATGAAGGSVTASDRFVESGDPNAQGERLEVALSSPNSCFGTLRLVGPTLTRDDAMTAASLAAQAAIALENANLHQLVARQAMVDGLTSLANRRHCDEALATEVARARRSGRSLAIVLADLDGFKQINDVHGHAVGDLVLREFADVIRTTLRESDFPGRWGGEEFLFLLPETDTEGAALLAERVRAALERRTILTSDGVAVPVTASFGVATCSQSCSECELIAAADAALYQAKRDGKNRVVLAGDLSGDFPAVAPAAT
jgi:diguanylate cyclase (GGDEF)-like protein